MSVPQTATQSPPTGTVTFLFTDIEGSTRLWEKQPDAMRVALARHDALLRQAIEAHGGHVFKTVGDGVCAAFSTADGALRAALDAQTALHAEPWEGLPGGEGPALGGKGLAGTLRVRMALHTGGAEERDGDYFGPTVNRVARLLAVGHGGQVLASAATRRLAAAALPGGVGLADRGAHRLKDLGQPEHVWQLCHPALPSDFPPLRSLQAAANNLPLQMTSFVGRRSEIYDVTALLHASRLVTLTGAGGCGKTRLALQVGAETLERWGDGVWLAELAPLSDPALVAQALAGALAVREEPGRGLTDTLADHLRPRTALLILDNCEHLLGGCAALAQVLLQTCPGVSILATSREALNIPGEQPWRVPPLPSADPGAPYGTDRDLAALLDYDAVRLFVDRACVLHPAFALSAGNAPAVAQVCARLDGIPLAIELAAARVRALSVEQINARLDQRFRLLTGGARTALPRQQTLRALIDWSYDLLTDAEKTLLRRLSVFTGGWTLEAAEAVCAGDGVEEGEVLDGLTGLVDKSLAVCEEQATGDGRYGLLETVRQYAGDRLEESGEGKPGGGVCARHAGWCLWLAEEAEQQLRGSDQAAWMARLEAEHDNLRAALAWYERRADGIAPGLRLAGSLWRFWDGRGHFVEGRQWLGRALARSAGAEAVAQAVRAKALNGAGNLALAHGDHPAAQAFHEESLAIRRELGDVPGIAGSLNNLGLLAERRGDYTTAWAFHEESLALERRLGDPEGIAGSLGRLGIVASSLEDYAASRDLLEQGLVLFRQAGSLRGIANTVNSLGDLAYKRGDHAAAWGLFEQGLAHFRELGHERGIAMAQTNLGILALQQGDHATAAGLFGEALAITRRLEDRQGIAYCLEGLAGVAHGQGHLARAVRLWGAAAALREALHSRLVPVDQEEVDTKLASARAALGEESFAAAWATGRALTPDEAADGAA